MSDAILSQFKAEVQEEIKVSDRKFRIGIIGTGGIAGCHAEAYKGYPNVEIVAGADIVPGKAKEFMENNGFPEAHCYTDYKEMIANEKLDGVSICTYNTQHAEPAIYCMEHDLPVLLEKPFTVTLAEAEAVCKAEAASKAFITIGFQPRYDLNMQMVKRIVKSGVLGKIYYIQTGGGRRRGIPGSTFIEKSTAGVGALGDIGCYALDVVLNALDYPKPLAVSGYTSDYFGKNPKYNGEDAARFSVDDFAAAFIRLEGDIILDFRIAWAMHVNTPGDTIIFGTEGALRIPSTECWNGSFSAPMTLYHDVDGERAETKVPLQDHIGWTNLWLGKIGSFLNAIETGGPAPVSTSQILYNQAIIDGIARSAECGREVEIHFAD